MLYNALPNKINYKICNLVLPKPKIHQAITVKHFIHGLMIYYDTPTLNWSFIIVFVIYIQFI